jgi:soluble lytic murein transglycosylase-like protein
MYRGWRTRSDGAIEVTKADGTAFVPILTAPKDIALCDAGIARWSDPFRVWGQGVRWEWLIAMAFQESRFNPNAVNPEVKVGPEDDGIGLFQITHPSLKGRRQEKRLDGSTHWVGGYTDEQLKDPQLNTTIASRYILDLTKRYGNNFPKISAAFNAGSVRPSDKNPWGMHSTGAHITYEVAALNYTILRGVEEAPLFDLVNIAREADDAARDPEVEIVWEMQGDEEDLTPTVPGRKS